MNNNQGIKKIPTKLKYKHQPGGIVQRWYRTEALNRKQSSHSLHWGTILTFQAHTYAVEAAKMSVNSGNHKSPNSLNNNFLVKLSTLPGLPPSSTIAKRWPPAPNQPALHWSMAALPKFLLSNILFQSFINALGWDHAQLSPCTARPNGSWTKTTADHFSSLKWEPPLINSAKADVWWTKVQAANFRVSMENLRVTRDKISQAWPQLFTVLTEFSLLFLSILEDKLPGRA